MADPIPFEPENVAGLMQQRATLAAVDTYDDEKVDPERAARAIQLGRATGTPPGPIYEDLDNFEKQGKQVLAQSIVENNKYIQNYINKYALGNKVSSDDWGQLDDFTQSAVKLGAKSVLHKTFEGFKEGFDYESLEREHLRAYDALRQNPIFANYWIREATLASALTLVGGFRGISGIIHGGAAGIAETAYQTGLLDAMARVSGQPLGGEEGSARLARDLIVGANVAMSGQGIFRGPLRPGAKEQERIAARAAKAPEAPAVEKPEPGIKIGGVEYPPAVLSEIKRTTNKFDPYLRDGEPPPAGLDVVLDEFWAEQAKNDAKNLKELEQKFDATETAKRVPDEFGEHFVDPTTENMKIGIKAEAIPPEDPAFIDIPGVREQEAIARGSNGDIVIPISEWLKLDPEVRDQLRDHVRMREGGMTVDEVNKGEQVKPEEKPLKAPKFLSGDSAVDAVNDVGEFNSANPIQERKLNLARTMQEGISHIFDLTDDLGRRIGDLRLNEQNKGKDLYISWVGAGEILGDGITSFINRLPNGFGPRAIRDLLEQIRQEFPNAETISGHRISGAREAADAPKTFVKIPLRGMSQTNLADFIRTIPGWEVAESGPKGVVSLPAGANLTPHTFATHSNLTGNAIAVFKGIQLLDHIDAGDLKEVPLAAFNFFKSVLKNSVGNITVRIVTQKEMDRLEGGRRDWTPGYYHHKSHEVVLSDALFNNAVDKQYSAKVIMHEMTHAFTSRALGTDPRMSRDMIALAKEFASLQKILDPKSLEEGGYARYALGDVHEFIAEAWSNRKFQEALAQIPMSPQLAERLGMPKGSLWDGFKKRVADIMQQLWGIRPTESMLDGIIKITERIEEQLKGEPSMLEPGPGYLKGRQWLKYLDEPLFGPPKEPELPLAGTTRIEDQPVFKQATAAGITAPMLKGWLKYIDKKFNETINSDMKKVEAEEARKQTKEWKENREAILPDAAHRVYNMSEVQADEILRTGRWMNKSIGRLKIEPEGLSPEQIAAIPADYIASKSTPANRRISKDDMAAAVKLPSGDILIERLAAYNDVRKESGLVGKAFLNEQIKREADRLMESKYGKLKENILLESRDRVINDSQLDYMHEWLIGLASENKRELPFTKAQVMEDLQRQFDEALTGTIKSKAYTEVAGKAVRGMTEQFIKENPAEALKKHTEQFFATVTAKIAAKFEKAMVDFKKTTEKFHDDKVRGVNQEFTNQIHRLMNLAGIPTHRTLPEIIDAINKDSHGHLGLEAFVEHIKKDGWEIEVPDWLTQGGNIPRLNNMKNKEAMEFKEFIDSLEHIGRKVEKIEIKGANEEWQVVKKEIIDTIKQLPERSKESQERGARHRLYQLDSSLTRMEEMVKDLDLRQELGPLFNAVIEPMMKSKAKEFDLITDLSNYFKSVRQEFGRKWRKTLDDDIPQDFLVDPYDKSPYKLKRSHLINIMLNWGTPSNRWKFSAGYASALLGRRAKPDEIALFEAKTNELIHDFAKKEDWDFVQAMWVPFKKWQPMMDTVARNTTGVSPRWIVGDVIKTHYGDVQGEYWPVKYSRYTSNFEKVAEAADDPNKLFGPNYFAAATSKGHLKERTRYIDAVDIDSSIEQAAGVMQQVIHDIAFRDALIQANKVFTDKDIKAAARNHYGQEYVDQWMPWLRRIANKNSVNESDMKAWNWSMHKTRTNLIGHALPLNLRVILSPDVGTLNLRAWKDFRSNYNANYEFVMENSREIKHLVYNMDRDFREQLEMISTKASWSEFQRRAVQFGFTPVMKASQEFRMITWLDKYNDARAGNRTHNEAVVIADSYVRERHGAASIVDLPAVMSKGEWAKSATIFYSFFNMTYNWQRQIKGNLRRGEYMDAITAAWGAVLIPAAFGALLFNQAKEDDSTLWTWSKALMLQPLQTIPIIGPLANWGFEGFQPRTPYEGLFQATYDIVKDVMKALDDKPVKHPVRHMANVIGLTTGLPLAQIGRTGEFLYDVATDQQQPEDIVEWARGIISGEAKLKKH